MAIPLRVAAVIVGTANAFWFVTDGGNSYALTDLDWSEGLLILLAAMVAGLVASEVLLRLMKPVLEEAYLVRYAKMVLVVCLGGALLGTLLPLVGLLFDGPLPFVGLLVNPYAPIGDRLTLALVASFLGAIVGGVLGVLEGLVLAFPLAAILGIFGRRDSSSRQAPAEPH